jgi:hypothetical protein
MLGSRERLPQPRPGPGSQNQSLVGHLEEFGSYPGVAEEALLKLQEGKVQGAKELRVGEVGESLLEVGDELPGLLFGMRWILGHLL